MGHGAHRVALAAAGMVLVWGAGAMAQDINRAPISGTINLDAGFTPDPKIISVTSGGRHDTSQSIGGACTGFVSGAPDVRVNYNTASTMPLIFSVTADGDTTLVINGPDGRWYCNDDTNGLDPQVRFDNPNTGRYEVWIGTYGGNEQMPARLSISEIDTAQPAPTYGAIDYTLDSTYGWVELSSGFTPDPHTVRLTAGGTIPGSTIDPACSGNFAAAPDVKLSYSAGSFPLIISVDSGRDTTLMINDSEGNWWCDDDGGINGTNPSIRFDKPSSGTYDIWVGTYSTEMADATLYISELNGQ